jgi:hypothetical protein
MATTANIPRGPAEESAVHVHFRDTSGQVRKDGLFRKSRTIPFRPPCMISANALRRSAALPNGTLRWLSAFPLCRRIEMPIECWHQQPGPPITRTYVDPGPALNSRSHEKCQCYLHRVLAAEMCDAIIALDGARTVSVHWLQSGLDIAAQPLLQVKFHFLTPASRNHDIEHFMQVPDGVLGGVLSRV